MPEDTQGKPGLLTPEARRRWHEPPFSDADLAHHQRWLDNHGQKPNPDGCALCAAIVGEAPSE